MDVSLVAQTVSVVVSGLLTVFLALVILIGAVVLMGKVLHREKPVRPAKDAVDAEPTPAPAAVSAPPAAPVMQVESGIEEETVAVISAAIAAMMDADGAQTPYQIAAVQRAKPARPVWELAGLMQNTRPF